MVFWLELYILVNNSIALMTDYEWESGRATRPNGWPRTGGMRPTNRSLEEFAALEYPKESPAWLLRSAERDRSPPSPPAGSQVPDTPERPKRYGRAAKPDA